MISFKNAALQYAILKFPVFPCEPRGKAPQTQHGFKDATDNPDQINAWWDQHPDYNIGLRTGIERDGKILVVVDVDTRNSGDDTLAALEREHGKLPDTVMVLTGGGGFHYYYWCPAEVKLSGKLGQGIDLKSRGGYVIAPPSIHPSGTAYQWEASSDLFDGVAIADLPRWIIDACAKSPQSNSLIDQVENTEISQEEMEEILADLEAIPADDRQTWLEVGMALHSRSSSVEMLRVYDRWSQTCPGKYRPWDIIKAWASFNQSKGITIRTLKRLAAGYYSSGPKLSITSTVQSSASRPIRISSASASNDDGWCEPVGFDEMNTPDIPARLLPGIFGEFAEAVARETETPEALPVMGVLGVIATAATKRFVVALNGSYSEPMNIYTLVALPPGNRKTSVFNACTAPLVEWESQQRTLAEPEILRQKSEAKSQERIIESKRAAMSKEKDAAKQRAMIQEIAELEANVVQPRTPPQLFANDATPESLANSTHEQGGRFAIFSDEGGITETLSGLYTSGVANVDILLKGIDGGHLRVKRANRSFALNPYLTIVLAAQPIIVQRMGEKKAFAGKGLLERFLWLLPKSTLGYRTHDKPPVPQGTRVAYAMAVHRLLAIPPLMEGNQEHPRRLSLSPAALERFKEFRLAIEPQLRPDGKLASCQGWGGKICGFALRLAGLMHIAEHADQHLIISGETMNMALELATLLIEHALCAFGLMALDSATADAKEVWRVISSWPSEQFTKRDLTASALRHKMNAERIDKALAVCYERSLIGPPQREPGSRTIRYTRNPLAVQRKYGEAA